MMDTAQSLMLVTTLMLITFSAGAETFNSTRTVKTTILTEKDAKSFQDEFGYQFESDEFRFKCEDNKGQYTCAIIANKPVLVGDIAKKFARNRFNVSFKTADNNFSVNCDRHSGLDYACIVQQKNSITS